jgi:membrane protein
MTSLRILVRAYGQWLAHGGMRLGAALAYYALFSFAPLLVISVTIAGAVFGEQAAAGEVSEHLRGIVGDETAKFIEKLVENAGRPQAGDWATLVSLALLVLGSLSMFLYLRGTLCTIWDLTPPLGSTVLGVLWDYTLALIMVAFCGILLLASLGAAMMVEIFQPTLKEWLPGLPWNWVEMGLSFLYLTVLFGAMYRILSGGRIGWGYVVYGSFIAAVLFTFGKTLLSWYFVHTSTMSAYGAAGSLVVFLMWIYYSSQVLFFGAELIQARRTRHEWRNSGKQ